MVNAASSNRTDIGGDLSNKRILLAGVAGFIGARTAGLLLDAGATVVGIDNLNGSYDVRLKHHRLNLLMSSPTFIFRKVDLEDRIALCDLFAEYRFKAIINLAARAGVRASVSDPYAYVTTNVLGTLNLLELAVRYGVDRYVFASTSSVYAGSPMPFIETADVTRPVSPYAATKLGAEALAFVWHHLYGIHVSILRLFTVYGPAGRPDMSPFRFIESVRRGTPITIFGDGNQTRDFTYIDDVARGTVSALSVNGFEVLNLGNGNIPSSINRLVSIIEEELGMTAQKKYESFPTTDVRHTLAHIDKARSLLGWRPVVPVLEGLHRTIAWHVDHADFLNSIPL